MTISTNDQEVIREYLLGRLDEDEQQKIEERLMLEEDLFDEFEVSKGELVEQYCSGELDKTGRAWFERHYLATPEGKEKFALAAALRLVKRHDFAYVPAPQPTFFQRITAFFNQQHWALASATVVILVVFSGVWLLSSSGPTIVGPELTSKAINRESGDDPPPKVALPSDAAALKLRLLLPQPAAPGVRYQAVLDIKTGEKTVEVVESDTQSVTVVIPAPDLPPGEYGLTLTTINPDGTQEPIPGQYLFNVNKT